MRVSEWVVVNMSVIENVEYGEMVQWMSNVYKCADLLWIEYVLRDRVIVGHVP